MATEAEREFYEKKASDEKAYFEAQEALRQLEAARAYHEKEREQSMRYYDKQRDEELNRQLLEKVQKEDKPLSSDEIAEIRNEMAVWQDKKQKDIESFRSMDARKEIPQGTLKGFDSKAAEIVEKGNVYTSVPFLQQARQLAAEQYAAFEDRQEELSRQIEQMKQSGDDSAAQVFEARKSYEAAAYERDTAESVLAKYEILYGKESKHYREQEEGVRELTQQAGDLYEKLSAVAEKDAAIREKLESVKVEVAETADAAVAVETPDQQATRHEETAEEEPQASENANSVLMDRVRDRVVEEKTREEELATTVPLAPAGYEPSEAEWQQEPPVDEAFLAEERAAELINAWNEGRDPFANDIDEAAKAEALGDEMLKAWDEGRDPFADDSDSDPDGHRQMQEDEYVSSLGEDEQRPAGVSSEPEMPIEVEMPGSTFEKADEKWVSQIESHADAALEKLESAKASGDGDAIRAARSELTQANSTYREYLEDRQDYQENLAEMKGDARKMLRDTSTGRAETSADFKESYLKASDTVSRLEREGKPWATDMRNDLNEHVKEYDKEDRQRGSGETPESSIGTAAKEAESEREADSIVVRAPPPIQVADYQQQERDRIFQQ